MTSDPVVRASWIGTIVFAVAELAGVVSDAARPVTLAVNALLFLAGVVVFFWAYAIAVGRSRTDNIGIGGLFFLAGEGTAPKAVQRALLGSLAAEVAVAIGAAAARPFTSLAFGVLTPLYGLALTGLWGGRKGTFGPRPVPPSR